MPTMRDHMVSWSTFLSRDLWQGRPEGASRFRTLGIRLLQVAALSIRGFRQNNCTLRASALTLYTLLSMVPVVAMAFGVAKGFGLEKALERELLQRFATQEEMAARIIAFSQSMLENTRGGLIAGIGVAVLLYAVIKVLSHIENAFNHIWQVSASRSLARKFSDYLSIMLVSPLVVIMSGSVTVFVRTQVVSMTANSTLLSYVAPAIMIPLKLLPFALIWLLLMLIYLVMPHTRVRLGAALTAAVIAGTGYQVLQWGYVYFQIGMARYNAIYGSFAALPLFMIWLQASWLVVLFGAEIAFAVQNVEALAHAADCRRVSTRSRHRVALQALRVIAERFRTGHPPLDTRELTHRLQVPQCLVTRVLADLTACSLLSPTAAQGNAAPRFQPSRDLSHLTVADVLAALERTGSDIPGRTTDKGLTAVAASLEALTRDMHELPANRRLLEL